MQRGDRGIRGKGFGKRQRGIYANCLKLERTTSLIELELIVVTLPRI